MRKTISAILVVAAVTVLAFIFGRKLPHGTSDNRSATLDAILHTQTLKVGYLTEAPYLEKDPKTGRLSGVFYDLTEELGSRLGLKVEWTEEVGLATLSEGLNSGRYDMVAFTLWRNGPRARQMAFSVPIFYSTLGIYVRAEDSRFDRDKSLLNSPEVRISSIDGEISEDIAKSDYPKAKISSLPQLSDYSQMLLEVVDKKADVSFFNKMQGARFMKNNPGKLKDISGDHPIRVYAECFVLPLRETALKGMIDSTLLEMIENGVVDKIFRNNGENPEEYYRPAIPYRSPVG